MEVQVPFRITPISKEIFGQFYDGRIISTLDKCGMFLCSKGEIEVSFEDNTYRIVPGDMYIYMASALVRVRHKSEDAEGYMVESDLNYLLPIANKVLNVEDLLHLRRNPCISLTKEQYAGLQQLLELSMGRLRNVMCSETNRKSPSLALELMKSMGQTLCYEVLNVYFINQPLNPLPQGKKDLVFQNFMVALFRFYRSEREVSFYARKQHLAPRYFSAVIKEKSGRSALQWIVKMVIAEAMQLLENSELSIKEISERLNFPTQSFFGKYFKQYAGVSPKEYRCSKSRF